jgi:murein DD-endopeptidase MepM/ murein hydrolase activator NlpD
MAVLVLAWLCLVPGAAVAAPIRSSTTVWPLDGPIQVMKHFDPPARPWDKGHRGVDLAAHVGDRVLAAASGRVAFAGLLAGRGVLVVDHGNVRTTYEPVSATVPVGAQVRASQPIGLLTTGPHCGAEPCLHWGLLRGDTYLDPLGLEVDPRPTGGGEVVLLPGTARAVAQRRAADRATARAIVATRPATGQAMAALSGSSGAHGLLRPVPGGVTSGFGRRFHPLLKVWKLHDGTDFGAACGTPILAPHAGLVTRVSTNAAYGNRLFIDHGRVDGRQLMTGFNHALRYVVGVGSRVSRGQVIGYVGATGYATGCHLHLMVWLDGRLTNPMMWF